MQGRSRQMFLGAVGIAIALVLVIALGATTKWFLDRNRDSAVRENLQTMMAMRAKRAEDSAVLQQQIAAVPIEDFAMLATEPQFDAQRQAIARLRQLLLTDMPAINETFYRDARALADRSPFMPQENRARFDKGVASAQPLMDELAVLQRGYLDDMDHLLDIVVRERRARRLTIADGKLQFDSNQAMTDFNTTADRIDRAAARETDILERAKQAGAVTNARLDEILSSLPK
ncbi:hypothetical protein BH10PSE17_BH10PSE17_31080 [soil metagenome]